MRANHARRGCIARLAPRTPCTRAIVLTAPQQVHSSHKAIQQGNHSGGNVNNGKDEGTDGTSSNGTDGDNDDNGIIEKVRRARTPSLHPCTCTAATGAEAQAATAAEAIAEAAAAATTAAAMAIEATTGAAAETVAAAAAATAAAAVGAACHVSCPVMPCLYAYRY